MSFDVNKPFGLHAASLYEITAPSVPTYDTPKVIPCPISLEWDREIVEDELEAADTICDIIRFAKNLTYTVMFGGVDLAIWAIALGESDPTDGGSTPNAYTYIDITDSMTNRPFGLVAQAVNADGGDTHIILFNCLAKEGPGGGFAQTERQNSEFSGTALKRTGGSQYARLINHETITTVPAAWPGVTAY